MQVELKHCCFVVELKTGCLIIGYLRLIADLLVPILIIADYDAVAKMMDIPKGLDNNLFVCLIVLIVATVIVHVTFDIALLIGVYTNRPKLVRPIIYFIIFVMISICFTLLSSVIKQGKPENGVLLGLNILVQLYTLLVIKSYYKSMNRRETGPAIYREEA